MISSEELRPLIWEYLRDNKNEDLNVGKIQQGVIVKLLRNGLIPPGGRGLQYALARPLACCFS